jgi:hypothetical protein
VERQRDAKSLQGAGATNAGDANAGDANAGGLE